jgi:hypothetical protein
MQAPQEFPPDVCWMYAGVGAAGHAWRRSRSLRLQLGASSPGVAAHPTPERRRGIPAGGALGSAANSSARIALALASPQRETKSLNPGVAVRSLAHLAAMIGVSTGGIARAKARGVRRLRRDEIPGARRRLSHSRRRFFASTVARHGLWKHSRVSR